MGKLNVFIANWNDYFQLNEVVEKLANNGTEINIISYNIELNPSLFKRANISIYNLDRKKNSIYKTLRKIYLEPYIQYIPIIKLIFHILIQRKKFIGNILCVEKGGVVLYSKIRYFLPLNCKKIYWSLELYTDSNQSVFKHIYKFKQAFKLEKKHLKSFDELIIQDESRYNHLWYAKHLRPFFFPVTTKVVDSTYSVKKYDLLYFGVVRRERGILEFLKIVNSKNLNYNILLNGPVNQHFKNEIYNENFQTPIHFSFSTTSDYFPKIFNESKIGVVWYDSDVVNDALTGNSSEKIARYLSYGMPIITNQNNSSYKYLMTEKVCFFVNELNICSILKYVLNNYEEISQKAVRLHLSHYSSEVYFSELEFRLLN